VTGSRLLMALLVFGASTAAGRASIIEAVTFPDVVTGSPFSGTTFGWAFSVQQTISVDYLGYFDNSNFVPGTQLQIDHLVGLWNDGTGQELGFATITPNDPNDFVLGHFRYHLLANAILLTPGPTYVVGGTTATGADLVGTHVFNSADIATMAGVTYLESRRIITNDNSLAQPTLLGFLNGEWGGSFAVDPPSPIPEPAGLLSMSACVGTALAAYRRWQSRR
jgi:hypothetical protein